MSVFQTNPSQIKWMKSTCSNIIPQHKKITTFSTPWHWTKHLNIISPTEEKLACIPMFLWYGQSHAYSVQLFSSTEKFRKYSRLTGLNKLESKNCIRFIILVAGINMLMLKQHPDENIINLFWTMFVFDLPTRISTSKKDHIWSIRVSVNILF